ncbi:cell wall-binding repeat-containing protein [Marinilactibacillus psychrotolerans]|uniref:cell wall-binding repeat-containing protein n=1 Tax=Marinilactibacillus psychrotolerans TaxID=191770 RepID=UPI001868CDA7|nr:cell wall-binding repeat-containing protein [Marinilactibacillus psychrotolerans]
MKSNKINKISKKFILVMSSSLVLVGSFGASPTYLTYAAEDITTENVHNQIPTDLNSDVVSPVQGIDKAYAKFLNSYFSLTEDEIIKNINNFQLFIDENKNVSSMIQSLNDFPISSDILVDLKIKIKKLVAESSSNISNIVTTSSSLSDISIKRISGGNRFRVAENISKGKWVNSDTVLLANGYKFTDALSGVPLAAYYDAPMLLVDDKSIEKETLDEINRLGAKNVIVLGGPDSVPESISQTLKNKGLSVRRLAGKNRYDTSSKIADELISLQGASTAHLVNGEAFADAVSISSIAGRYKQPILLTKSNELHSEVSRIAEKVKDWRIIGGPKSVNETVETQLKGKVQYASRVSGKDRYEVNKNVLNNWGIKNSKLYLGSGEAFADILTGSVLASIENTGVLLLDNNNVNIESAQKFSKKRDLADFVILGGEKTLSNEVKDSFDQLYRDDNDRIHKNGIYTVRRGDTFYRIAQSFNITVYQLSLWNKQIANESQLAIGNQIAVTKQGVESLLSSTEKANLTSSNNPSKFESVYDFINWMGPLAVQVSSEKGEEALYPSLMIAQAIHESGVARKIGESQLARAPYHNLFGIKAKSGQPYTLSWTWEYMNGERVDVLAEFRQFPSYKESLQVYASLLRYGRGTGEDYYYRGTWRSNTKNVFEVLDKGGLRGYATDPAYFTAVRRVINDYSLTDFDK